MTRSSAFAWRLMLTLSVCALAVSGCSIGRTEHTGEVTSQGSSSGASVSLHGNSAEASLERGKQFVMDAKFKDAIGAFTNAYRDGSASPATKAAALYALGQVYSNVLNPGRDRDTALQYFGKLVAEYPDAAEREDAQRRIEELQAAQ